MREQGVKELTTSDYFSMLQQDASEAEAYLNTGSAAMLSDEHAQSRAALLSLIYQADRVMLTSVAYLFLFADFAGGSIIYKQLNDKPAQAFFHHLGFADNEKPSKKRAGLSAFRQVLEQQVSNEESLKQLPHCFADICKAYYAVLRQELMCLGDEVAGAVTPEVVDHSTNSESKKGQRQGQLKTTFMRS